MAKINLRSAAKAFPPTAVMTAEYFIADQINVMEGAVAFAEVGPACVFAVSAAFGHRGKNVCPGTGGPNVRFKSSGPAGNHTNRTAGMGCSGTGQDQPNPMARMGSSGHSEHRHCRGRDAIHWRFADVAFLPGAVICRWGCGDEGSRSGAPGGRRAVPGPGCGRPVRSRLSVRRQ